MIAYLHRSLLRRFCVSFFCLSLSAGLALWVSSAAQAVSSHAGSATHWPEKPIHLIVPFPPGSSPDTLARALAEPLAQALGQQVVVENRPGAGGNIGTRAVARAAPDGYTLVYTINGPLVTAPTLYQQTLGYDPYQDLTPVTLVATSPNVLVVSADAPVTDVAALVALAKKENGKPKGGLNYGSVGAGSSAHLGMEMFKHAADIDLLHVPYNGFSQVITAIIAGDVHAGFMVPAIAMPQVAAGRARALAITSLAANPLLPGVPAMAAVGYPDFESISWNAILAPAGTPPDVVARLNAELTRIIHSEPMRALFDAHYFTAAAATPQALTDLMRREKTRWDAVIARLGLSLE